MRYIIIVLALIAIIFSGIYGVGSTLPEKFSTIRAARYNQPVEEIWKSITDVEAMPEWNPHAAKVEKLANVDGSIWRVTDSSGHFMELKAAEVSKPQRYVSRVINTDMPFSGEWVFELEPVGNGTLLRISENAEVPSPFVRFMSRYFFGNDKAINEFLIALGQKYGENVIIEQ